MALSYFTESEAPRDFRISSTESEGHYTKCLLCYTVKKNFYCPDCIRAGNFVHSSMPYADRFSEKQSKLLRLKANRKHILDRCEKLLAHKMKKDSLLTEAKQSRDRLDLLRLAIEQRKGVLEERRKQLTELTQLNTELRLKLPRYQKRVSHLASHAACARLELHARHGACADGAHALAALRRERVRQFNKYIFPVYISLDTRSVRLELHARHGACADGAHALAALRRERVRQFNKYIFPVYISLDTRSVRLELHARHGACADGAHALAALRRERVRQFNKYIFPVYISLDTRSVRLELHARHGACADGAHALAALRRERVRQFNKYIFPVYISLDTRSVRLELHARHGACADGAHALAALRRERVRQFNKYIFPVYISLDTRSVRLELHARHGACADGAHALAALRRERVRQFNKYIFPVYISLDTRSVRLELHARHGACADGAHALAALRRERVRQFNKYIFPVYISLDTRSVRLELHARHGACADGAHALAALRRERVRQFNKYIFPVYISLDTSDSIEDMEFLGGEPEEEPSTRTQLHIVAPWLSADGDHSHVLTWAKQNKEAALTAEPADNPLHRTVAALGLAAQFAVLLAWTLDVRLPHSLTLSEYSNWRVTEAGLSARVWRLCACAATLCLRANTPPPPPPQLSALHTLAAAAAADDPNLGRVEAWTSDSVADAAGAWCALAAPEEPDPPEHLHWPEHEEEEEVARSPPATVPAASLVTSAAASIASMWRGWTK